MNFSAISFNGWLQIAFYFVALFACAWPLGLYIAKVYGGGRTFMSPLFGWLERGLYKVAGVDPAKSMDWKSYACALLAFSVLNFFALYALLRCQGFLGFNPLHMAAVTPDLAFNIAASFVTNTNWQSYSGETTLSLLSQMTGLTVQNFISAAAGMAVLAAFVRGLMGKKTAEIGNFWVDLTRGALYILLPLAALLALLLAQQGVVQTFRATVETVNQTLALGPVASQEAIKQIGTNGGGFFNANAAHPFENPTPVSNLLEMLAILLLPVALCFSYGRIVGDKRQGLMILAAMTLLFVPLMLLCVGAEQAGNPHFAALSIDQAAGNMEGKEVRFGVVNSALWTAATTAASNGSTNAMLDSFTPLGGLAPLVLIQFGEVVYGGVGSGLCGMLVFVIMAVFIAGLMVGRTPEYLGKKIGAFDIKMASVIVLAPHVVALIGTALAVSLPEGLAGLGNHGAHGLTEILYAFSSAANNNGSAFAGLNANTPFYNMALGFAMLWGRFIVMIAVLALAGSMAAKNAVPESVGTLQTTTPLFVGILVCVVVIVGVLTFVPALALGPIAEHVNLVAGVMP